MRIESTLANLPASTTRTRGRLLVLFVLLGVALFFVSSMVAALPAQAQDTTITVNTAEDEDNADGDCSLREAIHAANNKAPRDACLAGVSSSTAFPNNIANIAFDLGSSSTIMLGSTLPTIGTIGTSLVIDGEAPGADVSLSGNDQVRAFRVGGGKLILQNLTITHGNANYGGAIYMTSGSLELSNVTISESKAEGDGGGIFAISQGSGTLREGALRVTDSTFSGNHANGLGGGIYYGGPGLEVTKSTFTDNTAGYYGGAIASLHGKVSNSTFAHNAASSGSAMYSLASTGAKPLGVMYSTFFNNDHYSGSEPESFGPSSIFGAVTLTRTLISERDLEACGNGVADHGYNIENGDSCGFSEGGFSMSNADAGLDPLGLRDNGGPTQTVALQPTSPAIDFTPECIYWFSSHPEWIDEDQRGENRPEGPGCDVGAFEAPPDVTPPEAPSIASPAQGSLNPGSFTISGTADVNTTVELFEGAVSKGTYETGLSEEWSIELSGVKSGSHSYTTKATDRAGNTSTGSSARTLTVDATAPEAPVITSPAEGGRVRGSFAVRGTTEANATVELLEGTTSRGTTKAGSDGRWSISLRRVTEGSHSYTAKATDAVGNTSGPSSTRKVIVDTTAPSVRKVVPVENATGIGPGANVSAIFSEAMRAGSVKSAFKLYKKGSTTAITATVTYDAATKRAILDPSVNLERGATYRAVLSAAARDLAGNQLDQNPSVTGNQQKVWFFTIKP